MTQPADGTPDGLPPNLSRNAASGQYVYRDPKTRRTKSLGYETAPAIAAAIERNLAVGVIQKGDRPKRFVRLASFTPNPGLLSEEEIRAVAQPIKQLCGVYLLLDGGRVVYVGQSTNCHARIGTHFYERGKKFDSYHIFECSPGQLGKLEAQYIGKFMPKYNALIPKSLGAIWETAAETVV